MERFNGLKDLEKTTWFKLEEISDYEIMFQTRDHGSVGDEEPGKEDVLEAHRLKFKLQDILPNDWKIQIDEIDEWVIVNAYK